MAFSLDEPRVEIGGERLRIDQAVIREIPGEESATDVTTLLGRDRAGFRLVDGSLDAPADVTLVDGGNRLAKTREGDRVVLHDPLRGALEGTVTYVRQYAQIRPPEYPNLSRIGDSAFKSAHIPPRQRIEIDVRINREDSGNPLSPSTEVVTRTDSDGIRLASIRVVERLADHMEDTADTAGERAMARVIKEYMNVLRAFVEGDSPDTFIELAIANLRNIAERLITMAKWYGVGKAILDVVAVIL